MDKDEILAKCRNNVLDEREENIELNSYSFGLITVLTTVILFDIWNWIHGIKSYEFIAILIVYLTTTSIYKYIKFRFVRYLISSIFGLIGLISITVVFFISK